MIVALTAAALRMPMPYHGGPTRVDLPLLKATLGNGLHLESGAFLIDTGANGVILPLQVAQKLQVDLKNAPSSHASPANGIPIVVRYAPIIITLAQGFTRCRWTAWVGFADVRSWLFGVVGGLEHFHFTFDVGNKEFILVPRESLPVVA